MTLWLGLYHYPILQLRKLRYKNIQRFAKIMIQIMELWCSYNYVLDGHSINMPGAVTLNRFIAFYTLSACYTHQINVSYTSYILVLTMKIT